MFTHLIFDKNVIFLYSDVPSRGEPRMNARRDVTNRARYVFDDEDEAMDRASDSFGDSGSDDMALKHKSKRPRKRLDDDDSDFDPVKEK